jgi:hypothetical protein
MGDGRTEVVFLWEARAMSEQNLLVSAGNVPAPDKNQWALTNGQDVHPRTNCLL